MDGISLKVEKDSFNINEFLKELETKRFNLEDSIKMIGKLDSNTKDEIYVTVNRKYAEIQKKLARNGSNFENLQERNVFGNSNKLMMAMLTKKYVRKDALNKASLANLEIAI